MSGHVLYTTMMVLLAAAGAGGLPRRGAGRARDPGRARWSGTARRSSPATARACSACRTRRWGCAPCSSSPAAAGRARRTCPEFIRQADEYRQSGDLADQVFKVLNLLGADHPFPVLRVAELRDWVEAGDYDRILRGEYRRRGEPPSGPTREDLAAAGRAYAEGARQTLDTAADAARRVVDSFRGGFAAPRPRGAGRHPAGPLAYLPRADRAALRPRPHPCRARRPACPRCPTAWCGGSPGGPPTSPAGPPPRRALPLPLEVLLDGLHRPLPGAASPCSSPSSSTRPRAFLSRWIPFRVAFALVVLVFLARARRALRRPHPADRASRSPCSPAAPARAWR